MRFIGSVMVDRVKLTAEKGSDIVIALRKTLEIAAAPACRLESGKVNKGDQGLCQLLAIPKALHPGKPFGCLLHDVRVKSQRGLHQDHTKKQLRRGDRD